MITETELVSILHEAYKKLTTEAEYELWSSMTKDFARIHKFKNKKFNEKKFYEDCKYGTKKKASNSSRNR